MQQSSSVHKISEGTTGTFPMSSSDIPPANPDDATTFSSPDKSPDESTAAMEPAVEAPGEPPAEGPRIGPGAKLGVFELVDYIGGGGMGRVFRALDTRLQRMVAVKVLSREQATDQETVLRFRNEAQSAARLNHENIVQVFYVGEEEGFPYIVFEYIEGRNIRAMVDQDGPLSLAEAVSFTFQIAEALAHASAQNIVHRDIKPSNVMVMRGSRAKLIDMGLARLQKLGDDQADLTASGVTLGTFDYISPEQARDPRAADTRSDIYSLGCTFFFMLTGQPPFPQGTVLQKLLQHQGEEPPDVRELRPELPREVSRVLRRMMAKDPRRRFQNPAQLIEALALLAFQVGLYPAGPTEKVWIRRVPSRFEWLQRHIPWIAPVAVLLAAVVGLNFYWSWPTHDEVPVIRDPALSSPTLSSPTESAQAAGDGKSSTLGTSALGTSASGTATFGGLAGSRAVADPSASGAASGAAAGGESPGSEQTGAVRAPAATSTDSAKSSAAGLRPEGIAAGISRAFGSGVEAAAGGATPARPVGGDSSPGPEPAVAPTSSTLAGGTAAAGAKPAASGVLIVDGIGDTPNSFASLEAAWAKAVSGNVIELRYNGVRRENPLTLNNAKLTVRAGEAFAPAIAFAPNDGDPAITQRAMIALNGGQLALVNLNIDFTIPPSLRSEPWSLIEARWTEQVKLEKCTLTIRDPHSQSQSLRPDAAFIRIKSPPGANLATPTESKAESSKTVVALTDCVVRGNACVVRVQDMRPLQFRWDNGLLVTTERLFWAEPGVQSPAETDLYRLDLHHLTAVVHSGLCRLQYGDVAAQQLPLILNCTNSILVGEAGAALIEQLGPAAATAPSDRIRWSGDRNFYQDLSVFWSVRSTLRETPSTEMSFEGWRDYWGMQKENQPVWNRVQWKRTEPVGRPLYQHVPADYALRPAAPNAPANPALKAANDGRDVGCVAERLASHTLSSPLESAVAPPGGSASGSGSGSGVSGVFGMPGAPGVSGGPAPVGAAPGRSSAGPDSASGGFTPGKKPPGGATPDRVPQGDSQDPPGEKTP